MRTVLLLLLAADGGSWHITTRSSDWFRVPDYFEQGPMVCGNGAPIALQQRDGGTFIVCDARKDGGR